MIFKAFLALLLNDNVMTISHFDSCHEVFEKGVILESDCLSVQSVHLSMDIIQLLLLQGH